MKRPKVSVCLPTYKRPLYLKTTVDSILNQSFTDFEVIIVDDASGDNTEDVVTSFHDNRIKFYKNESNIGLNANFNRCLHLAQGEYITVFGDDDVMLPDNLIQKVQFLDEHPGVGYVHSEFYQIDNFGRRANNHWCVRKQADDSVDNGWLFALQLLTGPNSVCFPTGMFRHSCINELGGFHPDLSYTLDWEFWIRLALHYDVGYIAKPLIEYRMHSSNESSRWYLHVAGLKEEILTKQLILQSYESRIPSRAQVQRQVKITCAKTALHFAWCRYAKKDLKEAWQCMLIAFRYNPQAILSREGASLMPRLLVRSLPGML